jgi:hypothetical protein
VIIQGRTLAQVFEASKAVCPAAQVKMSTKPDHLMTLMGYIRITTGTAYRT